MRRVLPDNKPTFDYQLWQSIIRPNPKYQQVRKPERDWLASIDRGSSEISDLWKREGRQLSKTDSTKVFDFISINDQFESLVDELKMNTLDLKNRIEQKIKNIPGAESFIEGEENSLLEINWIILGRVIGAAVANIGAGEGFWRQTGNDSYVALRFWADLKREVKGEAYDATVDADDYTILAQGIEGDNWKTVGDYYRQNNFDPDSEILRSIAHRASSPFRQENNHPNRYYANPFAIAHQKSLSAQFKGADDPEELAKSHGRLTLELLGSALRDLKGSDLDRFANFVIKIHGMCAFHIVRTDIIQQKIGLHLFSNLVARRIERKVGASNVPDIAKHLKTGFSLAKVLKILSDKNHKIIEWNSVEKEIVDKIVNGL